METVYVVTLSDTMEDPAVFAKEADAVEYADALSLSGPMVYDLLVCEGQLARKMIAEACGEEDLVDGVGDGEA